jgi:hypothetical protein
MFALNRHKKIGGTVLALALLAGCATATPYQPLGYPGERGGYTNQQLDSTHWRVSFVGNTLTSRERVENYLLFRSAELTLQQGFPCFTLVNRDVDRNVRLQTDPFGPRYGGFGGVGYYRSWSPYWHMRGPWGWHRYDPWMGGPFYPHRYDMRAVTSYNATADIALTRNCQAGPATFNAQEVVRNLQPYIVPPRR